MEQAAPGNGGGQGPSPLHNPYARPTRAEKPLTSHFEPARPASPPPESAPAGATRPGLPAVPAPRAVPAGATADLLARALADPRVVERGLLLGVALAALSLFLPPALARPLLGLGLAVVAVALFMWGLRAPQDAPSQRVAGIAGGLVALGLMVALNLVPPPAQALSGDPSPGP